MVSDARRVGLIACLAVLLMLSASSASVSACDRTEGDYWTYEISTSLDEIDITGSITYAYADNDTIDVEGETYEVSVMSVTGSASGLGNVSGVPTTITATYSGTILEDMTALATVKEDMYSWANLSRDTGQYIQTDLWMYHDVTTYSPPQGMEFVPGDVDVGDTWTETVNRTTNSTIEVNGVLEHESEEVEDDISFTYSVASSREEVTTDAGTFDCLKINLTDDTSDDFDIYWFSEDVGYFVKISMFSEGDDAPYTSLVLTSFQKAEKEDSMDILVIGIGVLVAVVVIVAVAMAMRKKGKKPQAAPPQTPPPAQ